VVVELTVDGIEGQSDGDQGHQESQEADEGWQRFLRCGEQPQEEKPILAHRFAQVLRCRVDRPRGRQYRQKLQDQHAGAGQVVRHLLGDNGPQTGPR
jgi:hypothetical protein